jgi:hypothetical protein
MCFVGGWLRGGAQEAAQPKRRLRERSAARRKGLGEIVEEQEFSGRQDQSYPKRRALPLARDGSLGLRGSGASSAGLQKRV